MGGTRYSRIDVAMKIRMRTGDMDARTQCLLSGVRRSVQLAGSTSDSIAQRRSLMMQQSVRNGFTVVDLDCARGGQWLSYVQDCQSKD